MVAATIDEKVRYSGRARDSDAESRPAVIPTRTPAIRVEKTLGSRPGRPEYEVFAPEGYSFDGPHSLIVRDRREVAESEGSSHPLARCGRDCDCRYDEGEDR